MQNLSYFLHKKGLLRVLFYVLYKYSANTRYVTSDYSSALVYVIMSPSKLSYETVLPGAEL